MENCFHCGDIVGHNVIEYQEKRFCCNGCKTVFDILHDNDLLYYYDLDRSPGTSPLINKEKFHYLKNEQIVSQLLDFDEYGTQIVNLLIPEIHCSSCIWILENLNKLNRAVISSQVNFPKKTVRITYKNDDFSLWQLVSLLSSLGYEPYISLDDVAKKSSKIDRSLIYKLGVAGFAFGNIMFLSFPEYFEVHEFWLDKFKHLFRWMIFVFTLPVVFYSAQDYFISAYKGLRSKIFKIDVPIALGIMVLFIRSTVEIILNSGTGFMDSLAGLVFFLLLGKFFQQKTYTYLSFERDYKSYFPIAVTRLKHQDDQKIIEEQVQVYNLQKGDKLLIRNSELLAVDAILLKGKALLDYSFVTGESHPVLKHPGDHLFAGGKQQSGNIEVEVLKSVEQSYLTQLWSNKIFSKDRLNVFESLTDHISRHFTVTLLVIAIVATSYWLYFDPFIAFNVFTAVLIVACPCAIALAAPFTLGNLLRIFGRHNFYLKDSSVIEMMAQIDTIVFDKTGTLTTNAKNVMSYEGLALSPEEVSLLTSTLRASSHPLSRSLYNILAHNDIQTLDEFTEEVGHGISGKINHNHINVGSLSYLNSKSQGLEQPNTTAVHISTEGGYKGCYIFNAEYRKGLIKVFQQLQSNYNIIILSGDNEGEKAHLSHVLPGNITMLFNQKPEDKLKYIKKLQKKGRKIVMIGDGLNDAGALAQSNVGFSLTENINAFCPASDGILDASRFEDIPSFLKLSKWGTETIKYAFFISLLYNLVGLGFAVSGNLSPIVAAILMPLSSISIVIFTMITTYFLGKILNTNINPI